MPDAFGGLVTLGQHPVRGPEGFGFRILGFRVQDLGFRGPLHGRVFEGIYKVLCWFYGQSSSWLGLGVGGAYYAVLISP